MKKLFKDIFYNPKSKKFILVNNFLSLITLISVISISLETVEYLQDWKNLFYFIEIFFTVFFTIEYFGRIIGTEKKLKYIFSFFGFIDLISILPTILGLGNLTFLKTARLFRILKFLRVLRITKFIKYQKNNLELENNNQLVKINLEIYFTALIIFAFFSSILIWLFEVNNPNFTNIPESLLWSFKLLLGGVTQEMPQTLLGDFVVILTRFFGLILFALLINLIANLFKKFILNEK